MKPDQTLGFPKSFLWGSATASHQVEGGNYNQWTVWELENAKTKSVQAEYQYGDWESWNYIKTEARKPDNYVSGKLANHYENYEEDFEFLKKMHMNAYRFSVEWSRIEPSEGQFDTREIEHYKNYVAKLKAMDIEPVLTLFHFSLPVWFADKGGFERRSNVKYFVRFAKKIVSELGSNIRFIITINEPEVYAIKSYYSQEWPPMGSSMIKIIKVLLNLGLAHRKTAKMIHAINRRYKVSIAKSSSYIYAGDNSIVSRVSAYILRLITEDLVLIWFLKGCDFLGVNFYQTNRVLGSRIHNPEINRNDLDWYMNPSDIEFVLDRYHRKYKLPIMITENGLADSKDENRKWWISETILAMQRSMKKGVKLLGYLHWSLLDNFEWAHGKWPRFGLVSVNYKTNELKLRPSAEWFGRIIKKVRGL